MVETLTELRIEKNDDAPCDVACFVLLTDNKNFNIGTPSYALDMLGKPTYEWVTRVCPTRAVTIECDETADILKTIKPYLRDKDYTLCLYGDTPLLTRAQISKILDFVVSRGLNVCKLSRGYVFKTDYIRRVDEVFAPQTYYFNEEEFACAHSLSEFGDISAKLLERIVKFHQSRGVQFIDEKRTYIESDVTIAAGVTLEPDVFLAGQTHIGRGVKVMAGAKIVSSQIGDNVTLGRAIVTDSVIKNDAVVGDECVIKDASFVGAGCVVGDRVTLEDASLSQNVNIGASSTLMHARIYRDVTLGVGCVIAGKPENGISRVLTGAQVGDAVTIFDGVAVTEKAQIVSGAKLEIKKD